MENKYIKHTKKWITDVVIACNFCPFAAKEVKRNTIRYHISELENKQEMKKEFLKEFEILDIEESIETSLIIYPTQFPNLMTFLSWIEEIEIFLEKKDYDGIYQIASFHPDYIFAGSSENDASNFTNRSPYPMLHILKEESLGIAIDSHPDTELIPEKNIKFANEKGIEYMKKLRDSCFS